jgi:hypothetical protein
MNHDTPVLPVASYSNVCCACEGVQAFPKPIKRIYLDVSSPSIIDSLTTLALACEDVNQSNTDSCKNSYDIQVLHPNTIFACLVLIFFKSFLTQN